MQAHRSGTFDEAPCRTVLSSEAATRMKAEHAHQWCCMLVVHELEDLASQPRSDAVPRSVNVETEC